MIQLLRIDDRLLHGMTSVSWSGAIGPDVILVVNDASANDAFASASLKLAKPPGVAVVISTIAQAKEKLQTAKYKNAKVFVITDCLEDAFEICKEFSSDIKKVNFGMNDVKKRDGLVTMVPQVYMTESDFELAKKINEMGIEFFVQAAPSYQKMTFEEVKKKFNK